jgi:hypothetical protein
MVGLKPTVHIKVSEIKISESPMAVQKVSETFISQTTYTAEKFPKVYANDIEMTPLYFGFILQVLISVYIPGYPHVRQGGDWPPLDRTYNILIILVVK